MISRLSEEKARKIDKRIVFIALLLTSLKFSFVTSFPFLAKNSTEKRKWINLEECKSLNAPCKSNSDWGQCTTDSKAKENIAIRVFNHEYKASISEVLHKLDIAQLERRGFTKTVINKTVATGGSKPVFSTALQFFKAIPCKRVVSVEQEIRGSYPEAWGADVSKRVVSAVSRSMDFGGKMCTAGIEVHLPRLEGCAATKEKRDSQPNPCPDFCLVCFLANWEAPSF